MRQLLIINTGSTSTRLALYSDTQAIATRHIDHSQADLATERIIDQLPLRQRAVETFIQDQTIAIAGLAAIVARGGLLRPMPGGCYEISRIMVDELRRAAYGEHGSNLSALLARPIAAKAGCPAYIVDPVVTDELQPLARYSGLPELPRRSIFHALNHKAVARRVAQELGKDYEASRMIVAHLGGGISVGAHCLGRVIDVSNALDGEGPFSPERSGGLPAGSLLRLCFEGGYSRQELERKITGRGGLVAYLGTSDVRQVMSRIESGDEPACRALEAMAYQVAKEIGAMATVLAGDVEAIVLTGGLTHCELLVEEICKRVMYIAPVRVLVGEDEMDALAQGALRVLNGEAPAGVYPPAGAECDEGQL